MAKNKCHTLCKIADEKILNRIYRFIKYIYLHGYEKNATLMSALRESTHNILYTAVNSAAMNGIDANTRVVMITPLGQYWMFAADVVIGLVCVASVIGIIRRCKKNKPQAA